MEKETKYNRINSDNNRGSYLSDTEYEFHVLNSNILQEHAHENYIEMEIVDKGAAVNYINNQISVISEGDVSIILPGTYHRHSAYQNYKLRVFDLTIYTSTFEKIAKTIYGYNAVSVKNSIQRIKKEQLEIIRSYASVLLSTTDESTYNNILKSLTIYVMGLILVKKENKKEMPEWLKEFMEKIDSIPLENLKIKDLYKLSNYSQSVISINFNKYIGKSLVKYIDDRKMEYATNLLLKTNMSISEISYKIGFNSVSHLNHLFKMKYGCSPKEYRKNN